MPVEFSREVYEDCGTYAAAVRHGKEKTPTCDPCREARAEYVRKWRERTGKTAYRQINIPHEVVRSDDATLIAFIRAALED